MRRLNSGTERTRQTRPPRELDFHGLALERAAARREREDQLRCEKGTIVSRVEEKRRPFGEDRARLMLDLGSRPHLDAFLPFRDGLLTLFDFFARFSTRAEVPMSLDASAGMVSRFAVLFPRKNKHLTPWISHPRRRPSRRARRRGDPSAPRARLPRDPDLRAGAALVDYALEGRWNPEVSKRSRNRR